MAGEGVGEGRVEEGGGVRGCEVSRSSTRGYQAAVCVHVDTQRVCFGGDQANFAPQTGVKCRAAEAELVLVRLRWRTHEVEVSQTPDEPEGREGQGIRHACVQRC